jgi:hypothetical protein
MGGATVAVGLIPSFETIGQLERTTMLLAAMIAVAVMGAATLLFAVQSDRIGRKRLCMTSAVLAAL